MSSKVRCTWIEKRKTKRKTKRVAPGLKKKGTNYDEEKLHELFLKRGQRHGKKERRDGLEVVQRGENLFILGQPGAGKTTFLKQVTIHAARGEMMRTIDNQLRRWLPESAHRQLKETKEITQIPVFISLKEHVVSDRALLESVERELQICRFPDATYFVKLLLKSGRALVLWDGLDEVSQDDDQHGQLVTQMQGFMRQYRETQFVITCRVAASNYSFDNLTYLEMADFDKKQINTFLHYWFGDQRQLANQCREELHKPENEDLLELARIPLLLSLLAVVYKKTSRFPQNKAKLYEEALDALLEEWDERRLIIRGEEPSKELTLKRKQKMLAQIGYLTFSKGKFILEKRHLVHLIESYMENLPGLETEVDGEVILRAIAERHGIFVERARKLYSFAHLSFQEYFAAKFIAANTRQKSLEHLLDHSSEDQWREVFLLTASLLNRADADDFFALFLKRLNAMVAAVQPIQQILSWADSKTKKACAVKQLAYKPASLRAWHLARALDRTHVLAYALDLDHAYAYTYAFAHILALHLALDLDLALDRALNHAHANALDLFHANIVALDLDRAIKLCYQLGLNQFGKQLKEIEVPSPESSEDEWKTYAQELQNIIDEFRDVSGIAYLRESVDEQYENFLGSISWTRDDVERYTQYLKGTALLIDCLNLAAVSDRAGIEERLLLPS